VDSQIAAQSVRIRHYFTNAALEREAAGVENSDAIGQRERKPRVLLDQQDRQTLAFELLQRGADLLDNARGKPFRRLVAQYDAGIGEQRAVSVDTSRSIPSRS
jgi:hypothetical protein